MSQDELAEKLATYDIGLLPMPENKIWNLASPLKRSEYLASGMIVCGIDHSGHQIESSGDWIKLVAPKKRFHQKYGFLIRSLDRKSLNQCKKNLVLMPKIISHGLIQLTH